MNDWEDAKNNRFSDIKKLEKIFPGYSYSDRPEAVNTDEMVCSFLISELRKSDNKIFYMIQYFYEMQLEEKKLEHLKMDIEILCDEIISRYCEWKDITKEWLEKIIEKDLDLVENTKKFNETLDELNKIIWNFNKKKLKKYENLDISSNVKEIKKMLIEIVKMFKERECICNIKSITVQRTYERLKKEIENKY